ncbi:TraR/DksA family transcriptional regulator [Azoarcus indigens]|uniref:TraR/DksA family transcriptional regulator n=1 Tax=Azoarcus indigens TaxID=29545 RepID=A0A4R6EDQ5_9RHOO|nr:TraR/DksA family transcriptional regulator [Azoarcus indigens]NMG67149.1 TraR/DksA family transcriptional regulator [Azoarcus indigens]TDN55884.1 TraR/DksA family transcriptional regulator [Azoarcus indigens]
MSELSEQQLRALSELLDKREQAVKSGVHEHVDRLRASSEPGLSAPVGDAADQADLELLRDNENAAVVREVRELRDIEAARARLAEGEAGICIDCGDDIPFARLEAQPAAARCVRCQDLYERTHATTPEIAVREE